MSHIVMAHVVARPGCAGPLRAQIERLAAAVRLEPGNERFDVLAQPGRDGDWLVLEHYRDTAAFERHRAMPHTMAFNDALRDFAEGGTSTVTDLAETMIDAAAAPEVRGIDHVGVTVPDIEAASAFLAEALGARALYDVQPAGTPPMSGEETERQLGLAAGARVVHMRFMRIGRSIGIELFQVEGVEQAQAAGIADMGLQHLAIHTDDMAATCARFVAAGGTLLSSPHPLAHIEDGAGNRGVYGRTPWGMLVEFIHLPDGVSYPPDCPAPRWAPRPNT